MDTLNDSVKKVIENSEIITIATNGKKGLHLVATWSEYVKSLDVNDGKTIVIPAGGYIQTEKNLKENDRVELLVGSKKVQGKRGMGTGYRLNGHAEMITKGALMDVVKSKFPWARAALVIKVDDAKQLL